MSMPEVQGLAGLLMPFVCKGGLKLSPVEHEAWLNEAEAEGLTVPQWIRARVNSSLLPAPTRPTGRVSSVPQRVERTAGMKPCGKGNPLKCLCLACRLWRAQ